MFSKMPSEMLFFSILLLTCACRTSTTSSSQFKKDYIDLNDTTVFDCFTALDLAEMKKLLKEQEVPIKEFRIRSENTSNQCVGIYSIYTSDWKKFKKINYYGVTIPVLKFKEKLTINAYYLKNTPRLKDTVRVDADISEFKEKNSDLFTEEELKRMVETYSYGIDVLLKGYWRE